MFKCNPEFFRMVFIVLKVYPVGIHYTMQVSNVSINKHNQEGVFCSTGYAFHFSHLKFIHAMFWFQESLTNETHGLFTVVNSVSNISCIMTPGIKSRLWMQNLRSKFSSINLRFGMTFVSRFQHQIQKHQNDIFLRSPTIYHPLQKAIVFPHNTYLSIPI